MVIKSTSILINVDEIRKTAAPILKNAGVTHSAVFGSAARRELQEDSDIDLLIEFQGKKTLLDLVGLQQELEKALGRSVDLITRRSVYPVTRTPKFRHKGRNVI